MWLETSIKVVEDLNVVHFDAVVRFSSKGWGSILVLHVKKTGLGTVVKVGRDDLARNVFCISNDHCMYPSVACY